MKNSRKVEIAKTAGFCFGVKRAVDMVYDEVLGGDAKIATYGPIIHNEEVVKDLLSKGVKIIQSQEELENFSKSCVYEQLTGRVIIRSHGVGKLTLDTINAMGLEIVDATCPFVKKIHKVVKEASANGEYVVVIGNPDHPEVQGITGWVNGPYSVVKEEADIDKLNMPEGKHVCVVAQTTFNFEKFHFLVEHLKKLSYDVKVVNTICNATRKRQSEAKELALRCDVMIVIGGKNSSNTQKLYDICKNNCSQTYFIQTVKDLDTEDLPFGGVIGITAGASTPIYIVEEVGNLCLS